MIFFLVFVGVIPFETKSIILRGKRNNFRVSKDNKKMENKDDSLTPKCG